MPTASGRALVVAGMLLLGAGWLTGSADVAALGAAGPALVAGAGLWVGRRPAVRVARALPRAPVPVSVPVAGRITVTNRGRRPTRALVVQDLVDGRPVAHAVPGLVPGGSVTIEYPLPTAARGLHPVGPLTVRRTDPLTLAGPARAVLGRAVVRVLPRIHPLVGPGPLAGALPAASVAGWLRAYVAGDDPRRIHWRASARAARLVVTPPLTTDAQETTVLVDTRADRHPAGGFEEAVEAAASVVAATHPPATVRLVTTAPHPEGETGPGAPFRSGRVLGRAACLAHLAAVAPGPGPDLAAVLAGDRDGGDGRLVVVTGRPAAGDLAVLSRRAGEGRPTVVIAVAAGPEAVVAEPLPGIVLVTVPTAADLALAWGGGAGRFGRWR